MKSQLTVHIRNIVDLLIVIEPRGQEIQNVLTFFFFKQLNKIQL